MDNEPNYRRGIWLLIRYHWGSVLAASFMVLFFLADMAIDFFLVKYFIFSLQISKNPSSLK
jgi:hypothetical protein